MVRHIITFIATFSVGAVVAFATRAAMHQPHTEVTAHTSAEHAAMVNNALTSQKAAAPAATGHEGHATAAAPAQTPDAPVNTVCAICGMDVDPKVPTLEYQGKKIGFGCKMCPPKFKAEPDKYGPYYLRNEVIKK